MSTADVRRMVVAPTGSIRDALRAIEAGGLAIAFVAERDGPILGTLTDGDIRRAILKGADIDGNCLPKIMNRDFASVSSKAHRAEVVDAMRARGIDVVPILDNRRRLRGLHSLHSLIGAAERNNWALIMAGGKGERLRPLTDFLPKPMIPVAGRPILERLVLHLVGAGIRRIFISVNYLAQTIESHFGDGSEYGCQIEYLREKRALGTAGALALLPRPTQPVLMINGDLLTQFDVGRLLAFHGDQRATLTVGLRPHSVKIPYGVASLRGNRLLGIEEKPSQQFLINAGIYALSPAAIRLVSKSTAAAMTDVVEKCVRRRLRVCGTVIEDDWADLGRFEDLEKARGE